MTRFLITLDEETAAVSSAYPNHSLLSSWNNFVNKITFVLEEPWLEDTNFVQVILSPSTSLVKLNWNPKLTPNLSKIATWVQAGICLPGAAWCISPEERGLSACVMALGAELHPCCCLCAISVLPREHLGTYLMFLSTKMLLQSSVLPLAQVNRDSFGAGMSFRANSGKVIGRPWTLQCICCYAPCKDDRF